MEYRLIRSDRRTLALEINAKGELVARAPLRMPTGDIEAFIQSKRSWIEAKQADARDRAAAMEALSWHDGAVLPYLDGSIRVSIADVHKPELRGDTLLLPREGDVRAHGRRWLRGRADELLAPRAAQWARTMGLSPKRLEWSTAKKRWGSMSSTGTLRLNIALLHCPWYAIDYVIVHELAHMRVLNHSPAFYALVQSYLPDADRRRAGMKGMGGYTLI